MAYNLSSYNLTAFNAGSSNDLIWLDILSEENVTPSVGTNSELYLYAILSDRISSEAEIGNGMYLQVSMLEEVDEGVTNAESSLILSKWITEENVTCLVQGATNVYPLMIAEEAITSEADIGSNIMLDTIISKEIVNGTAVTDKELFITVSSYEVVNASVTMESVDILVCEINTVLHPGDRLVIDAQNYNVLLNNENLIWAQNGAWIDEMTRETTSIAVSAASGVANLSASILYTERYL